MKGEALSAVIIDKLPFQVPSDPLVSARMARVEREGGSAFSDYQLPHAVLRLKQGLGRLDPVEDPTAAMLAILDNRLSTKGYGKLFMASLPDYTRHGQCRGSGRVHEGRAAVLGAHAVRQSEADHAHHRNFLLHPGRVHSRGKPCIFVRLTGMLPALRLLRHEVFLQRREGDAADRSSVGGRVLSRKAGRSYRRRASGTGGGLSR